MEKIKINAYAKINLSLDVIGKREDGYHNLRMIMQEIDLKDIITISETKDENIKIICKSKKVPTDEKNIAYKAAMLMLKKYEKPTGLTIEIEKHIPVAGGLAGGSTDAAAVLKGLNEIWELNLTQNELMEIALELGSDIPFCIMGGTALARGRGEELTPLKSFKDRHILLVNPDISVSTKDVYDNLDLKSIEERPDTGTLIEAVEDGDTEKLAKCMRNVLESVTVKKYPMIDEIKETMMKNGALGSLMSGSGATVFGIFKTEEELDICKSQMENQFKNVIKAKTN